MGVVISFRRAKILRGTLICVLSGSKSQKLQSLIFCIRKNVTQPGAAVMFAANENAAPCVSRSGSHSGQVISSNRGSNGRIPVQLRVPPALVQELAVRPLLKHAAVANDDYPGRKLHRR